MPLVELTKLAAFVAELQKRLPWDVRVHHPEIMQVMIKVRSQIISLTHSYSDRQVKRIDLFMLKAVTRSLPVISHVSLLSDRQMAALRAYQIDALRALCDYAAQASKVPGKLAQECFIDIVSATSDTSVDSFMDTWLNTGHRFTDNKLNRTKAYTNFIELQQHRKLSATNMAAAFDSMTSSSAENGITAAKVGVFRRKHKVSRLRRLAGTGANDSLDTTGPQPSAWGK